MNGLDFGARVAKNDRVAFKVWAPRASSVEVEIVGSPGRTKRLERTDGETFVGEISELGAGADYHFVLNGESRRPDPMSRFQPHGVHGASRIVDPAAFGWRDSAWRGCRLENQVLYELHVGTFTSGGTFESMIERLPHLKELGVTSIELMPVAQFPGARNWGYDGVHLFAPQSTYGGPNGLKTLVDACHRLGLGVVLDVVYNHLGPEGNYLSEFAPFFTDRYRTPWGDAINVDDAGSDGVRRHLIENALYWLTEYHIDGLRLDAIDRIVDCSARHILEELATAFHARSAELGRDAFLIAESDLNDARVIGSKTTGGYGFDAQWSDDFHHAVRTVMTKDTHGYFQDFGRVEDIERAFSRGYVYDGRYSSHRDRRHGGSFGACSGSQLVVYNQTHDQVANSSGGARIASLLSPPEQRIAAALVFVSPNTPMLFMGEEYGETAPFHYFIDHDDADLRQAVVRGRQKEHQVFHAKRGFADPSVEATFKEATLDWSCLDKEPHLETLALYRDLIALRQKMPALASARVDLVRTASSEAGWLVIERADPAHGDVLVVCNFSKESAAIPFALPAGHYDVVFSTDQARYGGTEASPSGSIVAAASTTTLACPARTLQIYLRGKGR